MKRQHVRRLLLLIAMLAFPVTIRYFSPALPLMAAARGLVNGSLLVAKRRGVSGVSCRSRAARLSSGFLKKSS
ncbi:MAG: hypothetical protein ACOX41_02035 [Anaerovoracaceae bacterium]